MNEFEAIMRELNNALMEKKAEAEVGKSAPASDPTPDISLHDSDMTEEYTMNKDKSTKYQATAEHQGDPGTSKKTSEIGEKEKEEDKGGAPEEQVKSASFRANNLLNKINSYLDSAMTPIEKSASYAKGEEAAEAYIDLLIKQAEDTLQLVHRVLAEHVKAGDISGQERDRIISEMGAMVDATPERVKGVVKNESVAAHLIDQMFPHLQNQNKSPEVMPMQPTFQPAPQKDVKEVENHDSMESETKATIGKQAQVIARRKAAVISELEKAAAANDEAAMVIAKAKFIDLLSELKG